MVAFAEKKLPKKKGTIGNGEKRWSERPTSIMIRGKVTRNVKRTLKIVSSNNDFHILL